MSAALQILQAARAAGITVELDGEFLSLQADVTPDGDLLGQVRRHKAEIVELLRLEQAGTGAVPVATTSGDGAESDPERHGQELRERLLAYLGDASEVRRYRFGEVTIKRLDTSIANIEVSHAQYYPANRTWTIRTVDGEVKTPRMYDEHRIYVIQRDPVKLLLRLIWDGARNVDRVITRIADMDPQPLALTTFKAGDWLDSLPGADSRQ
jgi:hypothetical protein